MSESPRFVQQDWGQVLAFLGPELSGHILCVAVWAPASAQAGQGKSRLQTVSAGTDTEQEGTTENWVEQPGVPAKACLRDN